MLPIIMTICACTAIVLGFVYIDNIGNLFSGSDTNKEKVEAYEEEEITYEIIEGADTFNYTGDMQTYIVPAGVTSITIEAYGAKGGNQINPMADGGFGGYAISTIPVAPLEILHVFVGGEGITSSQSPALGGFNGGGNTTSLSDSQKPGSGGGASDVRISPYSLLDRIIVAGGGGGAGGYSSTGMNGGHGGGQNGADAADNGKGWDGKGGTQTAGGQGGGNLGNAGSFGQGGDGIGFSNGGGAGGGGYYGGGGGYGFGGGGGSSFTDPTASNVVHIQGERSENGLVIISYCINCDSKKELEKKETRLELDDLEIEEIEITRPEPPPEFEPEPELEPESEKKENEGKKKKKVKEDLEGEEDHNNNQCNLQHNKYNSRQLKRDIKKMELKIINLINKGQTNNPAIFDYELQIKELCQEREYWIKKISSQNYRCNKCSVIKTTLSEINCE